MCWNFEVSVAFAVAEVALTISILAFPASRKYWHIVPLLLSVIAVEAAEAVTWKVGVEPKLSRLSYEDTCPVTNRVMMWIIIIACAVQPAVLAWYVFKATSERGVKPNLLEKYGVVLKYLILLGILNIIGIVIRLILAETNPDGFDIVVPLKQITEGAGYINVNGKDILEDYPNSLEYSESCSYVGDNGHLHWQWGLTWFKYAPNTGFFYVLICLSVAYFLFILVSKVEAVFQLFVLALLLIWRVLYGEAEGSSMWCWSGIILHVFYFVYPNLYVIAKICKGEGKIKSNDEDTGDNGDRNTSKDKDA